MSEAIQLGREVGLCSHDGVVPLEGVRIEARLEGPCLQVLVQQRYRNIEKVPIEAVYVFPLPEDAAVCGFSARIGDALVRGHVEARDAAFATYDDAMMDGHVAFLMDQERPNIFTASVGNLPAGETVILNIRYVMQLKMEGAAWRLSFPTTVSPRYMPAQPAQVGQSDADRVNPQHLQSVTYGLQFKLNVNHVALRSVESPSHLVRTTLNDVGAEVTLTQDSVALDRDLVLLIEPKPMHAPEAIAVREADAGDVVLINFKPALDALTTLERLPAEVVFLVDCSGSMSGSSIEEAKRALQLCVRALNVGEYFNLYCFGSSYHSIWSQSRALNADSLAAATQWLDALRANLGGTEILAPIAHILQQPVAPGCARSLLLLTDGQVGNEENVVALAQRHAGRTPVFAFGIGAGASDHLVRGVARASQGEAEMIAPGERIEPKVMRMFSRVRSHRLLDLRLETGAANAKVVPRQLPALYDTDAFAALVRYPTAAPSTLSLHAGGTSWQVKIARADAESALAPASELASAAWPDDDALVHSPIALCWARGRIRDLENRTGVGSSQRREAREQHDDAQLVELGTRYGLLSSATSYVAVELRADATLTGAQLRKVPVALTSGWGGSAEESFSVLMAASLSFSADVEASPAAFSSDYEVQYEIESPKYRASSDFELLRSELDVRNLPPRVQSKYAVQPSSPRHSVPDETLPAAPDLALDKVIELLEMQTFDGHFPPSDALTELLGLSDAMPTEIIYDRYGAQGLTALVLAFLELRAAGQREVWLPAAQKADQCIEDPALKPAMARRLALLLAA